MDAQDVSRPRANSANARLTNASSPAQGGPAVHGANRSDAHDETMARQSSMVGAPSVLPSVPAAPLITCLDRLLTLSAEQQCAEALLHLEGESSERNFGPQVKEWMTSTCATQ